MHPPALEDILSDANLLAGWSKVRENQGGPGVDGETIADFERRLTANLVRLRDEVRFGRYRPQPLLRVMAPKKSGGERPLSIPAVRDRVLQSAMAIVLTPLFEAEFEDVSFAYRRGRSVDQAVVRIELLRNQGYRWVVDADIHRFFDEMDHDLLMKEVGKLVFDEAILHLIRLWIEARVHDGKRRFTLKKGVPQGSPISPMLSNLYLDHLDEALLDENKKIVRFADDFLVLCKSQKAARDALELTEEILATLRLRLNETKTQVVDFDRGFRFLGVQFIRSHAFKLKHAHEPPIPMVPAADKRRPSRKAESDRPPDNAMAAAFAEAGIEPDQLQPTPEPVEPPPETPTHRLDPRLRTLYLLRHGQVLGKESERLVIRYQGRIVAEVPAIKVDQIMVFGNAQITTQAMHFCLMERIPIYLLSAAGRYYGVVDSFNTDPVLLQKAQFGRADDPAFCLRLGQHFIRAKIANSRTLLKRLARKRSAPGLEQAALSLKRIQNQLPGTVTLEELRGVEGNGARIYFSGMQALINPDWGFNERNRQPPRDPVNAMLSYGYTLLFYNLYSLLRARGLNPHVGYLHSLRAGHPALVSDVIEEFRALVVDAVVWNLVLNRRLSPDDFSVPAGSQACRMNDTARVRLIRELEKKLNAPLTHPGSGLKLDYRRCMEHQINLLAAVIRGTEPAYTPLIVR